MDLGLKGKVALVTGGSQGIGYAAAFVLASEGADVVICARREGLLLEAARRITEETHARVRPIQADMARLDDVQRLVRETVNAFNGVHILVNNAGTSVLGHLETLPEAQWQESFDTKLFGFMRLMREVAPHMRRAQWGRIINIVGQAGRHPPSGAIAAGCTNAALLALTKSFSDEVARDGILVNAVCPSRVETRLTTEIGREQAGKGGDEKDALQELVRTVPIGRLGSPEEIANVIAFLASQRASFVCGTTVNVDGGYQRYIV